MRISYPIDMIKLQFKPQTKHAIVIFNSDWTNSALSSFYVSDSKLDIANKANNIMNCYTPSLSPATLTNKKKRKETLHLICIWQMTSNESVALVEFDWPSGQRVATGLYKLLWRRLDESKGQRPFAPPISIQTRKNPQSFFCNSWVLW